MIKAENLIKRFGGFTAVNGLSLDVAEGEIFALLGHNGAGKTTTIRMLSSILAPTEGKATIAGFDTVKDAQKIRQLTGLLTEFPGLYNRMKALDYLLFFGRLESIEDKTIRLHSEDLMKRFGMWETRDLRLGEYSKGMRQKMGLIRALIHEPKVIFLDEPTSAMDPHSAKIVRDCLVDLRSLKRTIILCTHNLAEAELLADRIAIIKRGRKIAEGTATALKQQLLGPPIYEVRLATNLEQFLPALQEFLPLAIGVETSVSLAEDIYASAENTLSSQGLLRVQASLNPVILAYGPDWFRYLAPVPGELNPGLIQKLAALNAPIISVSEVPRSLETVYLRLVENPDAEIMAKIA